MSLGCNTAYFDSPIHIHFLLLTTFPNSVTSAALARYDVTVKFRARIVGLQALLVGLRESGSERRGVGL